MLWPFRFLNLLYRVIQTKLLQEPVLAQCAPPPPNLDNLYHFFSMPMCQKNWAGVSPSLPIPKLTQYIQFVKSGQNLGQGPPPLIWTKSKRTAIFFGSPSLTLLDVKATFLFQTVFFKAHDVPRHPERRWNVLACGCVSREHRMLLDHLDHLAELRSSFSRIGLNCLDKDPPGLDRPRQV